MTIELKKSTCPAMLSVTLSKRSSDDNGYDVILSITNPTYTVIDTHCVTGEGNAMIMYRHWKERYEMMGDENDDT